MHIKGIVARLLLSASCFVPVSAFASLIQSTPFEVSIHGTGFGNVSTLITLQTQNGQTTSEAGCIGFGGSTTTCGITQVGKIKNTSMTEPVPAGVTDASVLRFIFNAAQPAGSSINVNQLEVSFYGSSTTPLFTAALGSPLTLTSTQPGIGNSGFVFQLDSAEAAQANTILSSVTEIGAGFAATSASGGPDTLFLATSTPSRTPEPASYALLGAGVVLLGLLKTKRTVR
jgi:hypothetical protein